MRFRINAFSRVDRKRREIVRGQERSPKPKWGRFSQDSGKDKKKL